MRMRRFVFLVSCIAWAGTDVAQLRKLYDTDRMFELRRALTESTDNSDETVLYRAAVKARFGGEGAAINDLRHFLETQHDSNLEREANAELAGAFARLGRYEEAARAWSEAIDRTPAKDPDRADRINTQRLNTALRDVSAPTARLDGTMTVQARRNGVGSWNVPVEVNGQTGDWIFDTGANLSTITESEARRMKLAVRDTTTYVSGSTGKKNPLRLAVADDLCFGNSHLRNVVFLVLSDQALYIGPIKYQITGILGLPAIRALGRLTMSAEGLMRIQTREPAQAHDQICFSKS